MSQRWIGQEAFAFGRSGVGRRSSLDDLRDLIDWAPIERQLSVVSCSAKGEPAWPPLALFKAMLLAMWYDLSDVKLAEALYDRASFRRYCGFSTSEATPERTTFVRFRKALVTQALDKALFDEITAQLKAKAIRVKTGTLVDATVIASASEEDGEARWVKHKGRAAVHGFKAHVGADANTALVEEVAVTPANVNDGKAGPDALPDAPGEVFADSAYRGKTFREAVRVKGGSCASPSPACGAGMRPKRWRALRLGISRSTVFAAASRRCLERGSAAIAFGACDGEDWQRPVCRSASPQSSTTSSAVPGFSPRSDDTAKRLRKTRQHRGPFLRPPIAWKSQQNHRKRRLADRSPRQRKLRDALPVRR
jgi:IS5 family transposase